MARRAGRKDLIAGHKPERMRRRGEDEPLGAQRRRLESGASRRPRPCLFPEKGGASQDRAKTTHFLHERHAPPPLFFLGSPDRSCRSLLE